MKDGDIVRISYQIFRFGMIVGICIHTANAYNVLLETGEIIVFNSSWLTVISE
jgi:hypothetical protein